VGNCGYSLFPTHPAGDDTVDTDEIVDLEPKEGMAGQPIISPASKTTGSLVNVAALTGHGTLRGYVVELRSGGPLTTR